MKYFIIAFAVLLIASCQDEELAALNEMNYILYNKEIKCLPVSGSDGFYSILVKDSIPYLSFIDLSGNESNLLNISDYFTEGQTVDSIANINLSRNSDDNLIISYTYTNSENKTTVQAIEVSKPGEVTDQLSWNLSSSDSITLSFNAVSKTSDGNWLIISSGMNQSNNFQPDAGGGSVIYLNIDEVNAGTLVNSSLQQYEGMVNNTFVLSDNSIAISFTAMQQMAPGSNPDLNTNYLSGLTFISSSTNIKDMELTDSISEIYNIGFYNNGIDLVGSASNNGTSGNTTLIYSQYNTDLEKITSFKILLESKFTATCTHHLDNQIIIGGYSGNRAFSNTDFYSSDITSSSVFSLNTEGGVNWTNQNQANFPEMMLGITNSNSELIELYAKKAYNTTNALAFSKTCLTGNTK